MSMIKTFLKLKDNPSALNDLAVKTDAAVFAKTDCLACGNCCKSAPPLVSKKDINRIAKHLNLSPRDFKRQYVLQDFDGSLSFDSVPCRFLGDDNKCSIYEVRPHACRSYPHVNDGDFMKRFNLHQKNATICPAVDEILTIMESKISKDFNV